MEIQNYLDTCYTYMKAMLLPIDEIKSFTPVDRNGSIYTFHPYPFKRTDAAHYLDGGYYDFSQQSDFFSPKSVNYLNRYGILVSIKKESMHRFRTEKYDGDRVYATKYHELINRPCIKTIVTVTIDTTTFLIPRTNSDEMIISDQIKIIKKMYLDYLHIYHNTNLIYYYHKPDWMDKQLVMIKEWANELIDYLRIDDLID